MHEHAFDGPRGTRWLVEVPGTRRERVRGLRDRSAIELGSGMLFVRCRSIHTFGMVFPITVVGLDRDLRVKRVKVLVPRRLLMPRARVRHILECAVDADLRPGDRLPSTLVRGLSATGGKRPAALRPSRR
jgi:uncharacterized protein